MPSLATGTNVYRPSEGTRGAASAMLLHGANAGTADSNGLSGLRDQELAAEPPHPQSSPSPPLPPSPPLLPSSPINSPLPALSTIGNVPASCAADSMSTSRTSTTTLSTSTASKRKQSALHASQSSASVKKQRTTTTGAVALNGIKESLDAFNTALGHSLIFQPEKARADTSPERWAKAMDVHQELEDYLDDDHMVAFIDLFRADMAVADAYLAIKRESLQKKWVEKQLTDTLGFPPL
jgi:hypothetical protein